MRKRIVKIEDEKGKINNNDMRKRKVKIEDEKGK